MPITCIEARDNSKSGTGAFAMVKEGGINYRYVKMYFKSQTGGDIKFTVDIYADGGIRTNAQAQPAGWIPQNVPQSNYPNAYPNYPTGYQPPQSPYNPYNRF